MTDALDGRTIAEVGDRDGDMLGDDPLGAWKSAAIDSVLRRSGRP